MGVMCNECIENRHNVREERTNRARVINPEESVDVNLTEIAICYYENTHIQINHPIYRYHRANHIVVAVMFCLNGSEINIYLETYRNKTKSKF